MIITITQLKYSIDNKSENPNDNIFVVHNSHIFVINTSTFLTYIPFGSEEYYNYDLREPKRKILNPDKIKEIKKSVVTTNDWSNIPYYPTTREKKENVAKYLISMGKPVPETLLKQINEDKKKEIKMDSFNNFNTNTPQTIQRPNRVLPPQPPINKYSPQYAAHIGVKPRAQASARIGLGGAY